MIVISRAFQDALVRAPVPVFAENQILRPFDANNAQVFRSRPRIIWMQSSNGAGAVLPKTPLQARHATR
jgi:hypothetical protein